MSDVGMVRSSILYSFERSHERQTLGFSATMEHVGKHFDLWDASMLKFDYLRVESMLGWGLVFDVHA